MRSAWPPSLLMRLAWRYLVWNVLDGPFEMLKDTYPVQKPANIYLVLVVKVFHLDLCVSLVNLGDAINQTVGRGKQMLFPVINGSSWLIGSTINIRGR